jgi:hypothetical protein
MKAYGSGCIDPHFLDLGTSWKRVISFTPRPLNPQEKSPRYPFDRRLCGPQSRSVDDVEKTLPGPKLRPLGCPSRRHFDDQCIYFTSPVYTLNNALHNSQKRRGAMMCSISASRQFSHLRYSFITRITNFPSRKIRPLFGEIDPPPSPAMDCTSDASPPSSGVRR